jgi:hypothetical protein
MCVAMSVRLRSRSPRQSAVSVPGAASESSVTLWVRLKQFADVWADGDGHSLLETSAVLKDARKFIPELADNIAALEATDSLISRTGIDSLQLHVAIHAALKEELRSNAHVVGSSIQLGDWTCIGRGFRARQIHRLLACCFDMLNAQRLR